MINPRHRWADDRGMRRAVALIFAIGLAGLACDRVQLAPGGPAEPEPAALAQQETNLRGSSDIDADRPASATRAPAPVDEPVPSFYRYVDGKGSLHFVSSLAEIPLAYRAQAAPAGGSGGGFTRVHRAAQPAGASRPFAYDPGAQTQIRSDEVVIYTAPWCGWCRKTLAWLDARDVRYDNRDIDAYAGYRAELIEKSGGTSIPFVEIGTGQVRGYSPERMERLLAGS